MQSQKRLLKSFKVWSVERGCTMRNGQIRIHSTHQSSPCGICIHIHSYSDRGFPTNPVNTGNKLLFDCDHQTSDPAPEPIGYTAFLCGPEEVFTDEWQHCTQHMVFGEKNAFMFSYIWDEALSVMKFPGVLSTFGKVPGNFLSMAC